MMYNNYQLSLNDISKGDFLQKINIKDSFFEDFSYSEIKYTNITATIKSEKIGKELSLSIELDGWVNNLLCDLCAGDLSIKIFSKTNFILKYTAQKLESNDEIIYVKPNQNKLSLKHLLFELVILSIPNKRQHNNNECSNEMVELIKKYKKKEKKVSDPRWDALKKLKE
ncbi:MAG: hypothetical protein CMP73_03190 [Flavobacteriales bacterium]|nr:hypothetical protein [Flavobacteriales bacterium]